jgi:hypothetical protein
MTPPFLLALLVATAAVPGDEPARPSHRLLDGVTVPFQDPTAIATRLQIARTYNDLDSLVQKLLRDPKLLNNKELQKQLPQLKEWLNRQGVKPADLLGNTEHRHNLVDSLIKDARLGEDKVKELSRLVESQIKGGANPLGSVPSPSPGTSQPKIAPKPPFTPPHPPQAPSSSPLDLPQADWVRQLAERLAASDSEWMRDLVRRLTTMDYDRSGLGSSGQGKAVWDALVRVGDWLPLEQMSKIDWGDTFPKWSWPEFAAPPAWSPGPVPSLAAPSEGAGEGLVWLLLAVVVGILMWRLVGKATAINSDGDQAWRPGPWPVSPARVTTRHDLIRAFEHLALLLLGPHAGVCHHRELAGQLGQAAGPATARHRQQAAQELALLYEQARYAPSASSADQPLSSEEQMLARRNLCLLAGMGGA